MPTFTLATFNMHYGLRPRGTRYDLPGYTYDVQAACKRIDADVIVLQELWRPDNHPNDVDVVADELGYELHELPLCRATIEPKLRPARPGHGSWGLGVLTRFPIVGERHLPIGGIPFDGVGDRQALQLTLSVEGTEVEVVGLHSSARIPHGPLIHLQRLRPQLPSVWSNGVIAGDLNCWGPPVAAILSGWRRAHTGATWPAHRPHSQLDHILMSRTVEALHGEVLPDVGSDHRPVRATLRVP
jgi:endonuclease/exonuclease/phosphatase family metal-dependent hydrolase